MLYSMCRPDADGIRPEICKQERKYVTNTKDKNPNSGYIITAAWMHNELGLAGCELFVYALIYSFTRTCGAFTGTRAYISRWLGCCRNTTDKIIGSLIEKGYIEKEHTQRSGFDQVAIRAVEEVYRKAAEAAGVTLNDGSENREDPGVRTTYAQDLSRGAQDLNRDVQDLSGGIPGSEHIDNNRYNNNYNNNYSYSQNAPAGACRTKRGKGGNGGRGSGQGYGQYADKPKEYSSFDTDEFWDAALRRSFGDDADC